MNSIKSAIELLEKDKVNNVGIINFIKNNSIVSISIIGESILVKGTSDRNWIYISCRNKSELDLIKNNLTAEDDNFAAIDDWMVPHLCDGKKVIWDLSTIQFFLPDDVELSIPEIKTRALSERDAPIVYNNSEYKEYISLDYVMDRINHGISAGIYDNNKLVSWAITQDDGAIGFLHTLDDYRRKRYGYNITLAMIEKLRSINELPFAYAKKDNNRSINLLCKLGFRENKIIHWFQVSMFNKNS